ncbi:MAG: hypothetical protein AAF558_03780 [Verrucomicrobiota bacterium]
MLYVVRKVKNPGLMVLVLVAVVIRLTSYSSENIERKNLYWPGNFESHLYGGCFSNQKKVVVTNQENHTPDGEKSWELRKGFQLIEFVVAPHQTYQLSFWLKTTQIPKIQVKVVHPRETQTGEKRQSAETTYKIPTRVKNDWNYYSLDIETQAPYPNHLSEVLLTVWSPESGQTFIDDIVIKPLVDVTEQIKGSPASLIVNPDFESGSSGWTHSGASFGAVAKDAWIRTIGGRGKVAILEIVKTGKPSPHLSQVIPSKDIAGKQIQFSFDAAYLSNDQAISHWSGVIAEVKNGNHQGAQALQPTPKPHWYPLGLASPLGVFQTIKANYNVPKDSEYLFLSLQLLPKTGPNQVAIDNVQIRILD